MNLTKILIRLLLLASIVGGGIYFVKQKTAVKDSDFVQDFEEKKEELQGSVKGVTDSISSQTKQLTNRGQEISKHISNILGTYIKSEPNQSSSSQTDSSSQTNSEADSQANPSTQADPQANSDSQTDPSSQTDASKQPIYEETFEYGRYLYCQQVIEDYEKNQ